MAPASENMKEKNFRKNITLIKLQDKILRGTTNGEILNRRLYAGVPQSGMPAFVLYYQQSKIKSVGEPPSGSYYPKMILKSDPIIINTCFKSNYVTTKTTSVTSHFNLP